MRKIKYKNLHKTAIELTDCLRNIPKESDGKVEFFTLLDIIKNFCDEPLNEDQAAMFSKAIASTLYPEMEKRGGLLTEDELKNVLKKHEKTRKSKFCRLMILRYFVSQVSYFEVNQDILNGKNKIDDLLVGMTPVPTTPFNDDDPYSMPV